MSWTNCSLGSIFSSPDLWGLLHAVQFLTVPDKAHILKLDLSIHYPPPCDLYWATSSSVLSLASFRVALLGSTIVLRLQVQMKDHFLEPLDPLQSHCLSEGLAHGPERLEDSKLDDFQLASAIRWFCVHPSVASTRPPASHSFSQLDTVKMSALRVWTTDGSRVVSCTLKPY